MISLVNKTFGSELVRLAVDSDEVLFVAKDVCVTLGYKNPADAVAKHCKGVVKRDTPTAGGMQTVTFIPESDVYRLVMRSKLPNAEKFQDWVCNDVLPTIRQTGSYTQDENTAPIKTTGDPIMDMLTAMMRQREEVLGIAKQAMEMNERLNTIEAGSIPAGWNTIGELARMVGISKNKALEIIAAYAIPKKKIPQAGERISFVTVADEERFNAVFEEIKTESVKIEGSNYYKHEKLGRFSVKERN